MLLAVVMHVWVYEEGCVLVCEWECVKVLLDCLCLWWLLLVALSPPPCQPYLLPQVVEDVD